jgi:glycosyltransferase involved in cell wall biosynthesis
LLFCSKYIDHILYSYLVRLSGEVTLHVVCSRHSQESKQLAADGIRVTKLRPGSRFDRSYRAQIEELYKVDRWNLIHCFHGNAELSNLLLWNSRRIPLIGYRARIGNLGFLEAPAMYWSVRNPRIAAVAVPSRAVRAYLASFRFLKPRNVHVLPHGLDYDGMLQQARQPAGLRTRIGAGPDDLIVAVIGNLRPQKRFDVVVEAAERLRGEPIRFVHIGKDDGWSRRTNKLDNIAYLGFEDSPWGILGEADIAATTAENEAFGRANLEAMACGKPLIGADSGGLPDLIEPDVNGLLFEPGNARDFAAKLQVYVTDRRALRRHANGALERTAALFSTDRMLHRYRDLYSAVLRAAAILSPAIVALQE